VRADEICVIVQIETAEALHDLERIGGGGWCGRRLHRPSRLAASSAISATPSIRRCIGDRRRLPSLRALGKPAAIFTTNEAEAEAAHCRCVDFVGVATERRSSRAGDRADPTASPRLISAASP